MPARIDSIRVRAVSPSGESLNCTPMPAVRLPCAPAGVIQTTLPDTGRRSLSSISESRMNTSSPIVYCFTVGTNRPPPRTNGM
jgi:hypothetical protein